MKLQLLSFLFINSLLLAFDYKLQPKELMGANTHCFFGHSEVMDKHNNGNISNSCFVDMGDAYLVIDSGSTYTYASQAYAKMRAIKDLPIAYVINTHIHDDHWLGNGYFKEQGAKIIGADGFKELPIETTTRMQKRISAEAYKGTEQIHPELYVSDKKVLDIGGKKVEIIHVNHKAHTASDLYVYIPSKKIVFVGDIVFNDRIPSIRDGSLQGWIDTLDAIRVLDTRYIVGGHGSLVDKSALDMTYNYLTQLQAEVSEHLENGVDIAEILNIVTMPAFKDVKLYDVMHRQNVEIAYRMLEWGDE